MEALLAEIKKKAIEKNNNNLCYHSIEYNFNVRHYKYVIAPKYCNEWIEWIKKNIKFPEKSHIVMGGKKVIIPRLQTAYGDEGIKYNYSGITVNAKKWKKKILRLKEYVSDLTDCKLNFCLVNYYKDGDDYIGPHRDKDKELDPLAPIVSVTFGEDRIFKFENLNKTFVKEFTIHNGDIIVISSLTNKHHKHSLPKQPTIKGPRWNFTFRKIIVQEI
jgi:alpha-ketoglutarate-dependent dioxygenase alkB family protein 2